MDTTTGLLLEGFVAVTLLGSPITMIPIIAIRWHGLIIVLATFTFIELFIPQQKNKKINKQFFITAIALTIIILSYAITTNISTILTNLPIFIIITSLAILFIFLALNETKKNKSYKPKIKLSIISLIIGFFLGWFIQTGSPPKKIFSNTDNLLRNLGFSIFLIIFIYKAKKSKH